MRKRPPGDDAYPVGYGKPPRNTRFAQGQSGNPAGRPKGSKNLATVLNRALNEKVTVIENGRQKQITKLEAAAKQLVNRAAGGDYRALSLLLPQLALVDASLTSAAVEAPDANDQEVMAALVQRFAVQDGHLLTPARPTSLKTRHPKKPK